MSEVLNIYQKLAKIRKPVEVIKKNRKGYGYTYVDEEEILSKITGLMGKYGVSLIPNITHGFRRCRTLSLHQDKGYQGRKNLRRAYQ